MKKFYKNIIDLKKTPDPIEHRQNISKEIICHADYMPKTLSYEDIDRSFKEWVENKIEILQDGKKLPTMVLYSNQRFSEYMQTWQYTDENNNIRLNFKTVTRENNPSHGTIVGNTYNIPGERYYTFKSIDAIDESGVKYRISYKMKQPTAVDFNYKVSILTNKYITLNEFNEIVQQLFNAKQNYICPNGHYMSLTLENISDESEYNIQDRQFFSQSFTTKVKGYIIKENDLIVEETPLRTTITFTGDDAKRKKPIIELSEYDPCFNEEENMYKKEIEIDVDTSYCFPYKGKVKFTMDEDFILNRISFKEPNNIIENNMKLFVNDNLITEDLYSNAFEGYKLYNGIPNDANKNNTLQLKENENLPLKRNKNYKYLKIKEDYYIWHKIQFLNGDEIIIETKRINKYNNTGGFILKGYNTFKLIN